ncbi:hypothetical protein [Streptomyces sp. WAC 01529]|nr:hypothetical protein [Streptomyces sp. WAC 01529]
MATTPPEGGELVLFVRTGLMSHDVSDAVGQLLATNGPENQVEE